jgi:hypothetical protein
MKKVGLMITLCIMLNFTGCIKKYDYSEQKSDMGAEYMAGLLLKYDESNQKAIRLTAIDNPKGKIKVLSAVKESGTIPTQLSVKEDTTAEKADNFSTLAADECTLTEVINESDFKFTYSGYEMCNYYPKNAADTYFSLTPREKKQLFLVSIKAKNISDHTKILSLYKSDVFCQLDVNGERKYTPLNTLLQNDFQYINASVKAKKEKTVLLVFEVPKEITLKDIDLKVSNGEKSGVVNIK